MFETNAACKQHLSTICVTTGTEKDAGARHNWARRPRNVPNWVGGSSRHETCNYNGEAGQSINGVSFAVLRIFTFLEKNLW